MCSMNLLYNVVALMLEITLNFDSTTKRAKGIE